MLGERHHDPDAESDAVSAVLEEQPLEQSRTADVHVIQRITSFHMTPLPDAATLSAYARLIPNGADRIMSLVEREAAHRHRQSDHQARHFVRGHWMAYSLTFVLCGAGVYLAAIGRDWLAAALFTTTIGAVVTTLVVDKKARNRRSGTAK